MSLLSSIPTVNTKYIQHNTIKWIIWSKITYSTDLSEKIRTRIVLLEESHSLGKIPFSYMKFFWITPH